VLQKYHSDDLLNFMQYMKHIMQITQDCSEYDLMTNSVKFMQRITSALSEGETDICN